MSTRPGFIAALAGFAFPGFLLAQVPSPSFHLPSNNPALAILRMRSDGVVLVNGEEGFSASAIFVDDVIETKKGEAAIAMLDGASMTVTMAPETLVHVLRDVIELEHGSIRMTTAKGFRVRAGCAEITPDLLDERTDYDVSDVDGSVKIVALRKDVRVSKAASALGVKASGKVSDATTPASAVVAEGHQASRSEKCGAGLTAAVSATGAKLSSPYVVWPLAGIAGGAVSCGILCTTGQPASPSVP
jgi:hypothetical protein